MSTHNICFQEEIRKILCGFPILSGALTYETLLISSHNVCFHGKIRKVSIISWLKNVVYLKLWFTSSLFVNSPRCVIILFSFVLSDKRY